MEEIRGALRIDSRNSEESEKSFYAWGSESFTIGKDRGSKLAKHL